MLGSKHNTHNHIFSYLVSRLGVLVVSCLPLDQRVAGSNAAEDDGFLMAIKIRSTASLGGEVKPSVPCKILWHVKNPTSMKEIVRRQNAAAISLPIFSCFATRCLLVIAAELW
jgi:hypothetical protein